MSQGRKADHKSLIANSDGVVPELPIVARHDPLAERVRQPVLNLMKANGNMEQRELARRAKEKPQRVHKFVKGQMPYPPLTFLNNLLRVFSYTLPEALSETVLPVRPLAQTVFRPPVQQLAELLDGMEDAQLEHLKEFLVANRRRRRQR